MKIDFSVLDNLFDNVEHSPHIVKIEYPVLQEVSGELNAFYGKKHTSEARERMKLAAKNRDKTFTKRQRCANANKTWTFVSPEYKIVRIRGSLKHFCEQRGLNFGAMAALHRGKLQRGYQHKGWRVLNE